MALIIFRSLWIVILIFAQISIGQAASITNSHIVNDSIFASEFQFLIDDTGKENFETVKDQSFDTDPEFAFKKIAAYNRKRNIWAKVHLKNTSSKVDSASIKLPNASEVILYIDRNNNLQVIKTGYIHVDPGQKTMSERFYSTFQLEPNSEAVIWICINSYHRFLVHTKSPIEVLDPKIVSSTLTSIVELESFSSYFYFAFVAFLIFQIFYVSLQWFLAKRIEYGYYLSFISVTFLYFLLRYFNHSSYATSFDWTIISAAYINDILLLTPPYLYFVFGRNFLDLKILNPKLNSLIKNMEKLILAAILIVLTINYMLPNDLPKTNITMSAVGFQFILTIIGLYHVYDLKTTISRFLLVGSTLAFCGHIIAMSTPIFFPAIMSTKFSPTHFTMIGILIEIGVFNSGLLFKARLVELARIEAQQNLIDELRKHQQLQTEFASVREKISNDLHDDLGSNLSSIGVFSYAAKKKLALNEQQETEKLIQQIEQRAHESLQSLSDLVWSVNPINDSNEKLIARINNFIKSITQAKGIQYENYIDSNFYLRPINQLEKRNIQLLIKEAVNNIVKHAKAQTIILSIEEQNNSFCIKIVDNGVGFNTDTPTDGNGLQGMKKRIQEINGSFNIVSESGRTEICFTLAENEIDKKH